MLNRNSVSETIKFLVMNEHLVNEHFIPQLTDTEKLKNVDFVDYLITFSCIKQI